MISIELSCKSGELMEKIKSHIQSELEAKDVEYSSISGILYASYV